MKVRKDLHTKTDAPEARTARIASSEALGMAQKQGVCCESETNRHCHCDLPIDCDCPDCVGCTCSDASTSASEARTATIGQPMPTDSHGLADDRGREEEARAGGYYNGTLSSPDWHKTTLVKDELVSRLGLRPATDCYIGVIEAEPIHSHRKFPKSCLRLAKRAKWGNR